MRLLAVAAPVIALAAFLGGLTVSSDASQTAQQRTAASAPLMSGAVAGPSDNNGNG